MTHIDPHPSQTGITRRTVARGAAWSAPVIAVAGAAKAAAVSGPRPTVQFNGAYKLPVWCLIPFLYGFEFTITNTSTQTIWIYPNTLSVSTTPNYGFTYSGSTTAIQLAPNASQTFLLRMTGTNSGNLTFTGTYSLGWGHCATAGCDTYGHLPIADSLVVNGTPPDLTRCGY